MSNLGTTYKWIEEYIMRMRIAALLVGCLLIANVATAAELKIGVVDMIVLATQSEPAKSIEGKMKAQFGAERDKLEAQAKGLQSKADALQKQAAALSGDALEDKRLELVRQKRDFDDKGAAFARRVEQAQMTARRDMTEIILQSTKNFADRGGYTMIIDRNGGGVLYATDAADVTSGVLAELNKIWKDRGNSFGTKAAPASGKK